MNLRTADNNKNPNDLVYMVVGVIFDDLTSAKRFRFKVIIASILISIGLSILLIGY